MTRQENYDLTKRQFSAFLDAFTAKGRGEYYRDTDLAVYAIFERFGLLKNYSKQQRLEFCDRAILQVLAAANEEKDTNKRLRLLALAENAWVENKPVKAIENAAKRLLINDKLDKEFALGYHNTDALKMFILEQIQILFGEWWD